MGQEYLEKYFINPAIDCGIKNYISYLETGEYNRTHTFEMYVIKALCIIFGQQSILLPYQIDNERAFKANLLMYDFKENDMQLFIKCMQEFYDYMANIKNQTYATDLISKIEYMLIEMINLRGRKKEYTEDELKEFESIFNPTGGDLRKLKNLVASGHGLIVDTWKTKKEELTTTQIRLIAINPTLLSPQQYEAFGFNIKEVAILPQEQIEELNRRILEEEKEQMKFLVDKVKKILPN